MTTLSQNEVPAPRYTAETMNRKLRGMAAVVVDRRHPAGVKNQAVAFFPTFEEAQRAADEANAAIRLG